MKAPTTEYQSNGFGAFNENEKKNGEQLCEEH